jgi:Rps23 Pro-64 3,4-dihydroxylase Tpa1-like proline 4-hydroxylase
MQIINPVHDNIHSCRVEFLAAKPFPFLVIDDFLESNYYQSLRNVLNGNNPSMGKNFATDVESNKSISLNSNIPALVSNIVDVLNQDQWIDKLKILTGINTLTSTKNGNTMLANYHEMKSGGLLGSHIDHSHEPKSGLPHVLNIILYLSDDWKAQFGGSTLFYDKKGVKPLAKVEYKPNRAVIFLHTPFSFHGVERLQNNGDIKRKTLYVDYYSTSTNPYSHMKLDFSNKWFKHDTTFRFHSLLDYLKIRNKNYAKAYAKYLIKKLFN